MVAVDFGSRPPTLAALQAAGVGAVGRYFRPLRFEENKTLTKAEHLVYVGAGIAEWLYYEGAPDTLSKPSTGQAILDIMLEAEKDLGLAQRPVVYVSLDIDSLNANMDNVIANMRVIAAGWGLANTAFYGDYRAAQMVRAAGVASYFCLPAATSWGGGRPADKDLPDWVNLVQGWPTYYIGGVEVDPVTIRTSQYGQIRTATPEGGNPVGDYTTFQGKRTTPYINFVLGKVDDWLKRHYSMNLVLRDAVRTEAEQEAIFRERYVTAGNVNGRKVYDTRWWNGQLWYRISSAGTVAVPGTSNHQIQDGNGAVDIADSGADAGITVAGSARGRAFRQAISSGELSGLGIEAEGDSFGEGWHYKIRDVWRAVPGTTPAPKPQPKPSNLPGPEEMLKWNWTGIQRMLKGTGRYNGKIDNDPGWGTIGAFQDFVGAKVDHQWGPNTADAAQRWLKRKWGYTGDIDHIPGSGTKAAWDRAERANNAAFSNVR